MFVMLLYCNYVMLYLFCYMVSLTKKTFLLCYKYIQFFFNDHAVNVGVFEAMVRLSVTPLVHLFSQVTSRFSEMLGRFR